VPNAERFRNEAGLAKIAAEWPMSRLVEIWNSLPGAEPVKKFKDRATGVARIWKQIQGLEPVATSETALEAPVHEARPVEQPEIALPESIVNELPALDSTEAEAFATELAATEQQGEEQAPTPDTKVAQTGANVAPDAVPSDTKATQRKKTPTEPAGAKTPRENSKTAQVIAMLKRAEGTTVEEIMTSMGWLKHTTRAMLSAGGSLVKNHGLTITSEKVGDIRRYYIKG